MRSAGKSLASRSAWGIHLALCAVALFACGDKSPIEWPAPPALALSSTNAAFTGTRGDPVPSTFAVGVSNSGGGTLGGLAASVAYGAGQAAGWLDASLSRSTAPAVLTLSASSNVTQAGSYDATITVSGSGVSDQRIAVTLVLAMGEPPTIVVTSPTRAAMLDVGTYAESPVQITGEVCHPSVPITGIEVNGQAIPVSGTKLCEPFDVTQSSPWGMSVVTARVTNGYGRAAGLVQSYVRSPAFQSADFPPAEIPEAFIGQLATPVLDDLDRSTLDDAATFLEAALTSLDLRSLLPAALYSSPILGCDLLQVTTRGASMGRYDVTIAVDTNAINTGVVASNLIWGLRATYTGCLGVVTSVDGLFLADQINSSDDIGFTVVGDQLIPTLTNRSHGIVGPHLELNTALFIPAVADVIQRVVNAATLASLSAEEQAFINEHQQRIKEAFYGVEKMSRQKIRELRHKRHPPRVGPTRPAGNTPVYFKPGNGHASPGAFQVARDGVAESNAARTKSPSLHGPILTKAPAARPTLTDASEAAYGVKLDVLNQLLWVAWQTGNFEEPDLAALLGHATPGLDVGVSTLLPPILRPGTGGATLGLDWGDLAITAQVDPGVFGLPALAGSSLVTLEAYASARVEITLSYDATAEAVIFTSSAPDVQVQVIGVDLPLDETAIAYAIASMLKEMLTGLAGDFADAIPSVGELHLGDLSGLPQSIVLRFEDVSIGTQDGYVTLSGAIR